MLRDIWNKKIPMTTDFFVHGTTVNYFFYGWLVRQNSPYLLNHPHIFRPILAILSSKRVSILLLISNSSFPFSKSLKIFPSMPITTGIIVTLTFHNFLTSLLRSKCWSLFLLFLIFSQWSVKMAKSNIQQVLFFCYLSLGLVFWLGWGNPYVC